MYPAILPLFFLGILAFNWIDSTEITKKLIISSALLNGVIMIVGYYFKHYYSNFFTNVFI
jgi:hypothetical protein